MNYPLLISAAGILCCLLTTFIATDLRPARMVSEIENTLKYQLIISTLLATPVRSPPARHMLCYVLHPCTSAMLSSPALFETVYGSTCYGALQALFVTAYS